MPIVATQPIPPVTESRTFKVVGIGGTLREGSSTERLVAAVLDACARQGANTQLFGGASLRQLPHFNPESPERNDAERELVEAVRSCDALVIGTPGYHGGISGLVKNAIDLLEDLRQDGRPYFDGRPVGLVVSAAGWQATGVTLGALRGVVHAMRGWPTPVGIGVNSIVQKPFSHEGRLIDQDIAALIDTQSNQIMTFARIMEIRS